MGWSTYAQQVAHSQAVTLQIKTACQTRINQEFLTVIQQRAALNAENEQNINQLLVEALNGSKNTPAQNAVLAKKYLDELDRINDALKRATYPDIGSC